MSEQSIHRKKYAHIPHQLRLELIDLVEKENYPLSVASDLLGVKLSTAKLIMNKYKSRGYITRHKKEIKPEDQSHLSSSSKKTFKNTPDPSHQHETKCKADPKNSNIVKQVVVQNQRKQNKNEEENPFQNKFYGITPWNGLVFPFLYIWSFSQ